MNSAAIAVASAAALLEIVGIAITIRDIRRARRNLAGYLRRPQRVHLSPAFEVSSAASATVTGPEQTLEQRVEHLETWKREMAEALQQRDRQLTKRLTDRFDRQMKASEATLGDQLKGLRELVAGEGRSHWITAYKGPVILGVGVLVGLAGNIVGAL
ncbi:hypothetical protein [Streptomyces sp. Amel2xC10]|uniref:hypothetical protein n=1 Tax=Streptomyces sp. Amel2xC10 TaxID=1305826 RepID=UPI000A08FE48|nr:hypothetical protein [Streptomyces sp. Amel2xC10]SMF23528.1 hypothetical protein SAMN02745830_02381 [Streptomyces sp. Amel2xC10]